jgi:hypothetical protein
MSKRQPAWTVRANGEGSRVRVFKPKARISAWVRKAT